MTAIRSKNLLFAAVSLLVLFAFRASAQQISYYTFDTPGQNPSQYSCPAIRVLRLRSSASTIRAASRIPPSSRILPSQIQMASPAASGSCK